MANVAEQLFGVIYLCGSTDISLRIWPVEIINRMINLECREDMRIKSGARGDASSGGVLQMGAQGIRGHLGTLPTSQGSRAPSFPPLLYLSGSEMWHPALDTLFWAAYPPRSLESTLVLFPHRGSYSDLSSAFTLMIC